MALREDFLQAIEKGGSDLDNLVNLGFSQEQINRLSAFGSGARRDFANVIRKGDPTFFGGFGKIDESIFKLFQTEPTLPSGPEALAPVAPPLPEPGPMLPTFAEPLKAQVPEADLTKVNEILANISQFAPQRLSEIRGLLTTPTEFTPIEQQSLDLIRKIGAEGTAAAVARAQSGAQRRGITGSSIEQFGLAQAEGAGQLATQQALQPILLAAQERETQRKEKLADIISSVETGDVKLRAQAALQLADTIAKSETLTASMVQEARIVLAQLTNAWERALLDAGVRREEAAARMTELREQLRTSVDIAERSGKTDLLTSIIGAAATAIRFL